MGGGCIKWPFYMCIKWFLMKCLVGLGSFEKSVPLNIVSARDLEYEIKVFQKQCSESVRRLFSSWVQRNLEFKGLRPCRRPPKFYDFWFRLIFVCIF